MSMIYEENRAIKSCRIIAVANQKGGVVKRQLV